MQPVRPRARTWSALAASAAIACSSGGAARGTSADAGTIVIPLLFPDAAPPDAADGADGRAPLDASSIRSVDGGRDASPVTSLDASDAPPCAAPGPPSPACLATCPPSCPPPGAPCEQSVITVGAGGTCVCGTIPIAGCGGNTCPLNAASSSQIGTAVFTGSYLGTQQSPAPASLSSSGCYGGGATVAFLWTAPSSGVYTFADDGTYTYDSMGSTFSWPEPSYVAVLLGSSCAMATATATCPYPGLPRPVTLTLTTGTPIIIVLDFTGGCDTQVDPTCNFTAANYSLDITECTPACTGRECGTDGCGGSCGACPSGQTCSSAGACACVASCSGLSCGSDGCGGSCGSCPSGSSCSAAGQCVCTPSCGGNTCGSDGCGGSCGTCALDTSCSNGTCVSDPNACDPVHNLGCVAPNGCWVIGAQQTECALAGTGTQGSVCATTASCAGGYGCFAGVCRKFCDVGSGTGCLAGTSCGAIAGWPQYGACGP